MSSTKTADPEVTQQWGWKQGAHIPAGVSAEAIVQEKQRIEQELGQGPCSVEEATNVVLDRPEDFPAHRAFGAADAQRALRQSVEQGIRYAWRNVIRLKIRIIEEHNDPVKVKVQVRPGPEIRAFFPVPRTAGDENDLLVYDRIENIAADPDKESYLADRLAADAAAFASKVTAVTAELSELKRLRTPGPG